MQRSGDQGRHLTGSVCWWQAVGTELQGSALVKVGGEGVLHEKIAYFSSLPEKQD
jgi:hypothetical protein